MGEDNERTETQHLPAVSLPAGVDHVDALDARLTCACAPGRGRCIGNSEERDQAAEKKSFRSHPRLPQKETDSTEFCETMGKGWPWPWGGRRRSKREVAYLDDDGGVAMGSG